MTFHADLPQQNDMAARLAPIRAHFLSTLQPRRDRLSAFLAHYAADSVQPAEMRQLQEDAHKIRGVAPTLGFDSLGKAAAQADELLEPWHDSDDAHPVTDVLKDSLAGLMAEVDKAMTPR